MEFTRSIFVGTALAMALGTTHSEERAKQDPPGFSEINKNDDGALSTLRDNIADFIEPDEPPASPPLDAQ